MSQKLMLIKYELEDDIPIDESSENLQSTYAPPELIDWIDQEKLSSDLKTKESAGDAADIPITAIDDNKDDCLKSILNYVETKLIRCIDEAHRHTSEILVQEELDKDFSDLLIWLKVREIFKEKNGKYRSSHNIKLVIG